MGGAKTDIGVILFKTYCYVILNVSSVLFPFPFLGKVKWVSVEKGYYYYVLCEVAKVVGENVLWSKTFHFLFLFFFI